VLSRASFCIWRTTCWKSTSTSAALLMAQYLLFPLKITENVDTWRVRFFQPHAHGESTALSLTRLHWPHFLRRIFPDSPINRFIIDLLSIYYRFIVDGCFQFIEILFCLELPIPGNNVLTSG
jgi:hypothetical protein